MRLCINCNSLMEDEMMFCPECGVKYIKFDNQIYYSPNCPVVITEQNMFIDDNNLKGAVLFANVGEQSVSACSVIIRCKDQFGDDLTETRVKYTDLSIESGEFFGEDKVFDFSDSDSHSISVNIDIIVFEDGTLFKLDNADFVPTNEFDYLKEAATSIKEEAIKDAEEAERKEYALNCWQEMSDWYEQYGADFQEAVTAEQQEFFLSIKRDITFKYPDFIIPDGVTEIPERMFFTFTQTEECQKEGVSGLKSIYIPGTVCSIGKSAFSVCKNLENVTMSEGIKVIGECAFSGCKNLENVTMPEGIKVIGEYAFAVCKSLKTIVIPDSVGEIAENAFSKSKATVVLPKRFMNRKEWFSPLGIECLKLENVKFISKTDYEQKLLEDKERNQKAARIEAYWEEHLEEKVQLESEISESNKQISELKSEITELNRNIDKLREKCDAPSDSAKKKSELGKDISKLEAKLRSLSIFKGKEKKALQARIDELIDQSSALDESIECEKKAQQQAANQEIQQLQDTIKLKNDTINALTSRVNELKNELTRDR